MIWEQIVGIIIAIQKVLFYPVIDKIVSIVPMSTIDHYLSYIAVYVKMGLYFIPIDVWIAVIVWIGLVVAALLLWGIVKFLLSLIPGVL